DRSVERVVINTANLTSNICGPTSLNRLILKVKTWNVAQKYLFPLDNPLAPVARRSESAGPTYGSSPPPISLLLVAIGMPSANLIPSLALATWTTSQCRRRTESAAGPPAAPSPSLPHNSLSPFGEPDNLALTPENGGPWPAPSSTPLHNCRRRTCSGFFCFGNPERCLTIKRAPLDCPGQVCSKTGEKTGKCE
ncbi:MAG: hypothetical protein BJ554DRAFT_397, partial [Olpidium bornovanus]